MEKVSLVCDQCGSVDVQMIDDNIAKCSHCGTKFLIVPKKNQDKDGDELDFEPIEGCFAIKPNKDIEWFKRKAIIDLFLSDSTPLDICDTTFGEPYENISQCLITTVFYEGECIADIGYLSPFADKYSYDDSDYIWSPFKRFFKTDVKSVSIIDKGERTGEIDRPVLSANRVLLSCMKGELDTNKYICSMEELGTTPVELTDDIINEALRDNEKLVGDSIELPGDTQKIVSVMASHKVISLIRVAEKQYILPCEYKGEKFEVIAPSGGDKTSFTHCRKYVYPYKSKGCYKLEELVMNDKDSREYESKSMELETEAEVKHRIYSNKRKRESKIAGTIALCLGLAGVLAWSFSFLIGAAIIALSIGGYELFKKARDKHWEKLLSPLKKEIQDKKPMKMSKEFCYKLKMLERTLSQMGLAPITEDEIKKYLSNHSYTYGIRREW